MKPLGIPMIHMNGTSKEELLAQHLLIVQRLDAAIYALRSGFPNGRDFYPRGDAAWQEARDAFAERIAALAKMKEEFEHLLEAIDGSGR